MVRRFVDGRFRLFVPIISANTQARREGYFRIEWKLAAQCTQAFADGTPFLLPVAFRSQTSGFNDLDRKRWRLLDRRSHRPFPSGSKSRIAT